MHVPGAESTRPRLQIVRQPRNVWVAGRLLGAFPRHRPGPRLGRPRRDADGTRRSRIDADGVQPPRGTSMRAARLGHAQRSGANEMAS